MTDVLKLIHSLPLKHKVWMEQLFRSSQERDEGATFEEIIFRAKFVTSTRSVMERIGQGAQGYDPLVRELTENVTTLQKLLLTTITGKEYEKEFSSRFLAPTAEAFSGFLEILADCTVVKNALLDKGKIPGRIKK